MNGLVDGASRGLPPADPREPGWGGERNQGIFRRCLEVMEAHPGERLAVVIGGAHKAVLDTLFRTVAGVEVLAVPMPSDEQLDAAWTARHLVVTLGHNLDGERTYFHPELVDLPRMRALVERLRALPRQAALATYFRGRIDFMAGDHAASLRSWEALGEVFGRREPYPFPMDHWRMRYGWGQAIGLETARTLLALGRDDEAARILGPLADGLPQVPALLSGPGTHEVLTDADFEQGRIERSPQDGWYCADVRAGAQRAQVDAEWVHSGEHALRVDVLRQRERGYASLTQTVAVHPAMRAAGELTFSVHARAQGISHLRVVAYRWADDRMVELAQALYDLEAADWTEASLSIDVPDDADRLHLFLYYPGRAGGRIWFDSARLFQVEDTLVPDEWVPRVLAREFPRTLLVR